MLDERFGDAWEPVETADGRARADTLWARWNKLLPGGGEAALADRLALAGWTEAQVRARLGDGRWRKSAKLPAWTQTWEAVRAAMLERAADTATATANAKEAASAWRMFFAPFVAVGEKRLEAELRQRGGMANAVVMAEFRRLLALRLTRIAGAAFEFEFGLWSEARRGASEWLDGNEGEATRAGFVAELARTGAAMLERSYPVLLRHCCEQVEQLSAAWSEFAVRLPVDAAGLAERFNGGRALGEIAVCRGGLSDPHRGARSAIELRFSSGLRVIYKPRPMALEAGYFSLCAWLEARGVSPSLGRVGVWDRGGYGWMEWVEAAPCANRAAARRHFVRTGAHLALLQVLGGADFHSENWIAAGEFPLPIDLEVAMRPAVTGGAGEVEQSVLGVGLLPVWQASGNRVANISALAEKAPAGDASSGDGAHRAVLGGKPLAAGDFVEEIVEGFAAMHAALRRYRLVLGRAGGPLAALRRARLRHVARPTELYGRLMDVATRPPALGDGAVCSLELERLAKALAGVPADETEKLARMIAAEQRALARLDVPLLHGRVGGLELETGDGPTIAGFFKVSGWTACRRRLAALSAAETRKQAGLIRAAFAVARLGRTDTAATKAKRGRRADAEGANARPASRATLLAAARAIGRELAAQAVEIDGGLTWVAPQLLPRVERFQLSILNLGLYDGVAGVGLFFAALHRATGEAEWARFARGAFAPAVRAARDPAARRHLRRMPAGIGMERGGIVYALTHAADWLRQPVWLAPKQRWVELLAPQPGDVEWDVMRGAAGAIFAALRLAEATNDRAALDVAAEWGRRLVAAQEAMPEGGRAWRHEGVALGGMAHGAAGIAAALARLAAATGDEDFRRAAEDARAFEATLFVAEEGNWLDLRGARDLAEARRTGRCGVSWCHGAPGILLTRLAGLQSLDTAGVRDDIAAALTTTARLPAGEIDQCCCGEAGVIDILGSAAATLGRHEFLDTARRRAGALLAKARAAGGYNAFGATALPAGPGFFQGRAGIGYTWLRLAQPERFPSVLAFA
jgi:lantibiotic modifying enzyme